MQIGEYQIINGLARGGMSEIFVARHVDATDGERVIVKRLLPSASERKDMRDMFLDEGRITALFDHPHVVGCSPPAEEDGSWYLVMDYVEGTNLGRLLSYIHHLGFGLPIPLCAYVIACIAAGLDHAHRIVDPGTGAPLRIIHRDVSPDNILIGVSGEVKITDFGIAHGRGRRTKTMHGVIKGKSGYMSPEQANAHPLDWRSDLFSLGVVFHEMLTRQPLYSADAEFMAMQRIAREPAPAPSSLFADVPRELDGIALKALEKDPADRFQSGAAMAHALVVWLRKSRFSNASAMFADWLAQLADRR